MGRPSFPPLFLFAPVVLVVLAGFAALDFWLFFVHGVIQSARQVLYQPELFLMVFGRGRGPWPRQLPGAPN